MGLVHHRVVRGDTLWGIAQKYNSTVDAIEQANSWIENIHLIQPGWVFHVPVIVPPDEERSILVGASIDPRGNETPVTALANFEAAIGAELDMMRRFDKDLATDWETGGNWSVFNLDEGKRHRFISIKEDVANAGISKAQWLRLLPTIPDDGFLTYVTGHHEPDNDGGGHTPTWFKTKVLDTLHAAWSEMGRPAYIIPSLCLTGWKEHDSDNPVPTSSLDWLPRSEIASDFVFWFDPYDPEAERTFAQKCAPTVAVWKSYPGSSGRWGVAEFGTKRVGDDGAKFITDGFEWARGEGGCEAICVFHAAPGENGPWFLDDPKMQAAFGSQVGVTY